MLRLEGDGTYRVKLAMMEGAEGHHVVVSGLEPRASVAVLPDVMGFHVARAFGVLDKAAVAPRPGEMP